MDSGKRWVEGCGLSPSSCCVVVCQESCSFKLALNLEHYGQLLLGMSRRAYGREDRRVGVITVV